MHAANVCVTERLSARGVAELWAPGAPPLVSAELARRSLRRIATPASAFREPHNLVVQSASDVAKLLSLAAVHELVPLVASLQVATANKAPGKKAASAAVEATLVASHAMTRGAADGTVSVAEDDEGGAVPADVLREVREFWASNAKTKTASTDPFNDFLALWRASPGKVRDALKAAKTCLGWLRCLVAARCAAMAAASAGEDVDAAFRALAELRGDEARLEDAGRAVDLMKRASLRLAGARKIATQKYDGELRSVDLVHKEAWNALVALSDGECGGRFFYKDAARGPFLAASRGRAT
ncbi:hypothetical protein M885DRAFT_337201 [Pelagophyceae sp. CCMP2097]|nr:hypothetical protein M885DRAFT_337201 [Pelagophyceae sp. CCMP2097]